MVLTSTGTIALSTISTEAGVSGQKSLGDLYFAYFGVALASITFPVSFSTFYSKNGPKKKVHLDASTLSGTAGTQITTWTGSDGTSNATGNSNTGSTKPTLQISSGNYVNLSSSTKQYFSLPTTSLTYKDGSNNPINGLTLFLVVRRSTSTSGVNFERFIDFGNGAGVDNMICTRPGNSANLTAFNLHNSGTAIHARTFPTTDGSWILITIMIQNGSTLTYNYYVNGSSVTSTLQQAYTDQALTNKTFANCYIGRSAWGSDSYVNSDFREIIMLNNYLTTSQLSSYHTYLKTKWGIE
jgi:hypothetical protein